MRLTALMAVFVSCALLMHYLNPAGAAFCGPQSPCETVRKSPIGSLGFPGLVPSIGLAAYVGIFWSTFSRRLWVWSWRAALLGAVMGIALFGYQALVLHALCWLCVIQDAVSVFVAAFAFLLKRADTAKPAEQWDGLRGWAWLALLGLALNAPPLWPKLRAGEPLPKAIEQLQIRGVLTIVEFADFQCPHCRRLYPLLALEIAALEDPHRVVRFQMPLPFHNQAEGAARAAICAERFGKGEAMTDLLMAGALDRVTALANAAALGIPDADFSSCLEAESTRTTLAEHRALFEALPARMLPLTFVGNEKLEGYASPEVVSSLFRRAKRPAFARLTPYTFGAAVALCAALIFWVGRRR
jgi:uncharacterized membrane protein